MCNKNPIYSPGNENNNHEDAADEDAANDDAAVEDAADEGVEDAVAAVERESDQEGPFGAALLIGM